MDGWSVEIIVGDDCWLVEIVVEVDCWSVEAGCVDDFGSVEVRVGDECGSLEVSFSVNSGSLEVTFGDDANSPRLGSWDVGCSELVSRGRAEVAVVPSDTDSPTVTLLDAGTCCPGASSRSTSLLPFCSSRVVFSALP